MGTFLYIISNIIIPIFILIAIGFLAQKKLKMDVRTFAKVNMFIFLPAIIFTKMYRTEVTLQLFGTVMIYLLAVFFVMMTLGMVIARLLNYPRGLRNAFLNSILFFNGGNYGLPVAEIAFQSNPLATTAQIFIMVISHILLNTFGIFQASSGKEGNRDAFKNVLTMPAIHMLVLALVIKTLHVSVPEFLMVPVENLSKGFIPVALITLGVQLAEVKVSVKVKDILISSSLRLILAPIIGFMLVNLMGVEGILAKVLVIGVATPTAVNIAIIAREFNNEPDYSSQTVFASTLLSVITISFLILIMEYI
ncbi:MAG: hypothetical protein APF84_04665 [Gracilibacter sp. BRH_c7a]|nr:MAG: hypothetical protein APF84_04665 [Gracilibacter sp. BRH_c7a]